MRGWSATQRAIALSSGEAEYYGTVRGGSEGLGTQAIMSDLGIHVGIDLNEDSSAAKGVADRTGLGRIRHLEVNQLWLRQKVRNKIRANKK